MHKKEFQEAFAKLHASGDLEKTVLTIEKTRNNRSFKTLYRVVVCAAVLMLLIGTVFFWPTAEDNQAALFSVIVYADGTDIIELYPWSEENEAVSNVPGKKTDSYFDSMPSADYEGNGFCFGIHIKKEFGSFVKTKVFRDGKEVEVDSRNSGEDINVMWVWVMSAAWAQSDGETRRVLRFSGMVDQETTFEIQYLDEDDDVMLRCVVSVTPLEEGYQIKLEDYKAL